MPQTARDLVLKQTKAISQRLGEVTITPVGSPSFRFGCAARPGASTFGTMVSYSKGPARVGSFGVRVAQFPLHHM
eukprot:11162466-Lingulodinium_polyedra.AAC.1